VLMAVTTSVSGACTPARAAVVVPTSITPTVAIAAAIAVTAKLNAGADHRL
jgi:hypothetical protein